MLSRMHKRRGGRCSGFTLIELVVVLAILGILLTLAMPAYVFGKKGTYRSEAHNVLQEIKTLEWAYYQQYNLFDTTGNSIGFAAPSGMHWAAPIFSGDATQSVQVLMSGCGAPCNPIGTADQVSITLKSDGTSTTGSTF